MKLQSNNLLESLTTREIKKLTTEIKETLFIDFKSGQGKNFTSAQLWKIHRQGRGFSTRRFYGI